MKNMILAFMASALVVHTAGAQQDTAHLPKDSGVVRTAGGEVAVKKPHDGRLLYVYDAETGEPIEGVNVRDSLSGRSRKTDKDGTVSVKFLSKVGPFLLAEVRKQDYRPIELRMVSSDTTDLALTIERNPLGAAKLPPVVVTERSSSNRTFAGFETRCGTIAHAACLRQDELADHASTSLSDMFLKAPTFVTKQCNKSLTDCKVQVGKCDPAYFIDGDPWEATPRGHGALAEIENFLGPVGVKGIEIYDGDNTPLQFRRDQCGAAIVIWTK